MDDIYKEVFDKCYSFLVDNIEFDNLSDFLIQYGALPRSIIAEDIASVANRRDKVRKLIESLLRRSNETFSTFLECLKMSDQEHIAKKLMDILNEIKMMRPPEQQSTSLNETEITRVGVRCTEPSNMNMDHCLSEESVPSNCYEMSSNPRGLVLIINNETFAKPLDDRLGSSKDAENLMSLFSNFGFYCDIKNNLTVDEMKQCLSDFSKLDKHTNLSCCVVILMSHGEEDHIYGCRCQKVPVNELIVYFNDHNCPNLKDKPKLFIIQACRIYGNSSSAVNSRFPKKAPMKQLMSPPDLSSDATATINPERKSHYTHADMLLAYSTAFGNTSVRYPTTGSLFIQNIIEVFQKKAHITSVTDMLIEVNGKLREKYADLEQISAPEVALTKKWYLNPLSAK